MRTAIGYFIRIHKIASSFLFLAVLFSCEDFLDVGTPKTRVTTKTVYSSDATAYSALAGLYSELVNIQAFAGGGNGSIHMLAGLSSDEFISSGEDRKPFELNSLNSVDPEIKTSIWEPGYKLIYYANAILEGLQNSTGLSASANAQLEGEAKFIRAFCYFYMVNIFGEVPLVTSTDYRINASLPRSSVQSVCELILEDLLRARTLLSEDYSVSSNERIRPNRHAVSALQARVYLFLNEWENADLMASSVIDQFEIYVLENLDNVFLKDSKEAIWQLKPVSPGFNSYEGKTFNDRQYVTLRNLILNAMETDDGRNSWITKSTSNGIDFYHPYKYKISSDGETLAEYSVVLRLAEQYLIRAEARIHLNNLVGARDDINVIRNRAGLASISFTDQSALLQEIEHQRRVELFSEWGHRWFDLKRWDRAASVLGPLKGSNWQDTDVLYPIPQSERENNPNLTQNDGY